MKRTPTNLRAHLYEVLDHVAKTGQPVDILRDGIELSIIRKDARKVATKAPRTLPNLIAGDPDDLIHVEWPSTQGRDL